MNKTFTLTETAVKNLIISYASHELMCKEYEADNDTECTDYECHLAYCDAAEQWMKAIGICPDSKYVDEIIEQERR